MVAEPKASATFLLHFRLTTAKLVLVLRAAGIH
jgi:hypothetical protein